MPFFGANISILEGLRHVHYNPEEQAWAVGLSQPAPIVWFGLTVDGDAYDNFQDNVPIPRYNYMVPRYETVESYFVSYTRSSLDIITTTTADRPGICRASLIPPSQVGMAIFSVAEMPLKGALFGKWTYNDPITQSATCSHPMVYVADCTDNHVSITPLRPFRSEKTTP